MSESNDNQNGNDTQQGQQQGQQQESAPPWGADFDAEKAWNLIQNLRSDKEKLSKRPTLSAEQQAKLAEYERLEEASKTELERKAEEVTRWQTEAQRWRTASVGSTVRALAAVDFADPDDAVRNLDAAKYLGAGGEVDEAAIKADLAALLDAKPHYRRAADNRRVPAPNPAQGSGNGAAAQGDPRQDFAAFLSAQLK